LLGASAAALLALFTAHSQPSGSGTAAPKAAPSHEPPTPPSNPPQTEAQRKAVAPNDQSPAAVVNAFDQLAFFDHEPVAAMKKYLADDFIERYPDFAKDEPGVSDKEATIRFFETRGWKKGDPSEDVIYQVIAQKDRVAVFHRTTRTPNDRGTAWVDIFRVKNGLIVEHWGVGQPVSEKLSARHSMF
jgi:predicted SnoaL-like aldol condensation-catalyzing enzyme